MSEKIAKFPIANIRRLSPANDNRACTSRAPQDRPRLACRWSIDDNGRLGCRWSVEAPDEPRPERRASVGTDIHKAVFQPSYQTSDAAGGLRTTARGGRRRSAIISTVLPARH